MLWTILAIGFLATFLLFAIALMQMAGKCSRAEEEEERRRWEKMQRSEEANGKP